jgi:hypothetical protein
MVLAGAMGEIENVNHVFHPAGRLAASNSPYPFGLRYPCMSPTGNRNPICGPTLTNSYPHIPKGRLSWTARLTGNVPGEARCSVCEGHSPNILRYSTEKRPNSTKPKQVAISVTVTSLQSAHKRARLACDNRNIRRCRHGARPQDLWNALRSVRSLTSRVRHKAEMCSGSSICARANLSACSTRSLCELLSRLKGVSATISSH